MHHDNRQALDDLWEFQWNLTKSYEIMILISSFDIFCRGIRRFALYVANICWRDGQKKEKGSINAESFFRCGGMM